MNVMHENASIQELSFGEIEQVDGAGAIETAAAIGRFVGSVAVRGAAAGGAGVAAAAGTAVIALAVDYALDGELDLID